MFLSFESLETLPIIKKMPFSGIEKRILGFVVLLSTSIVLFTAITLLVLHFTSPKKEEVKVIQSTIKKTMPIKSTEIKYDSLEQEALLISAEAYLRKGNVTKAGAFLEKIATIKNPSVRQRRITADLLLHQGRIAEAKMYLDVLIKEEPKNPFTASLYIQTLSPQVILKSPLDSIAKGFSKNPDVLYAAAKTIHSVAPMEATLFLIESLNNNPLFHKSLFMLGKLYLETASVKDLRKAESMFVRATSVAPDSSSYWAALGITQQELWETSDTLEESTFLKSERAYLRAIQLKPQSSTNLYNLAELYSGSEKHQIQSEELYLKALKNSPSFWNASFKLGLLYAKNRKFSGAIEQFNMALLSSQDNIRILHQLAAAYESSGDIVESQRVYKQIVAIDPKDNISLYKLKIIK